MNHKNTVKNIAKAILPLTMAASIIITAPITSAFFTSSEGGAIAFSLPCMSPLGPGFWAQKTNSITPVIYLYPSTTMKRNYLTPGPGVTTLGLIGTFITCTTPTIPPVTLSGRVSTLYGTAFGF